MCSLSSWSLQDELYASANTLTAWTHRLKLSDLGLCVLYSKNIYCSSDNTDDQLRFLRWLDEAGSHKFCGKYQTWYNLGNRYLTIELSLITRESASHALPKAWKCKHVIRYKYIKADWKLSFQHSKLQHKINKYKTELLKLFQKIRHTLGLCAKKELWSPSSNWLLLFSSSMYSIAHC